MEKNRKVAVQLASAAAAHQVISGAGLSAILNIEEGRIRREDLSDESDIRAWAEGQTMSIEQAVELALIVTERSPAVH
jgi:hypothetical protein